MHEDYITIIVNDKIYSQRTPNSKFIEFDLNGVKLRTYEELPEDIQYLAKKMAFMNENPELHFTYEHTDDGVVITSFFPSVGSHVKIPDFIDGRPVIELSSKLINYSNFEEIIQIQLPDTIKKFGFECFKEAKNLQYINIPPQVETIPDGCFANTGIISLDLSNIKSIGNNAFYNCKNLNNVDLINATDIGEYAFSMCTNLTNIKLSNLLKELRDGVFRYAAIKEIKLPEGLQQLGDGTFEGCDKLSNINIPESLVSIAGYCFHKCVNITEFIAPENLRFIGEGAFAKTGVKKVKLNAKLEEVGGSAFNKCSDLIEVILHHPTAFLMKPFDFCNISKIKVVTPEGNYTSVKAPEPHEQER